MVGGAGYRGHLWCEVRVPGLDKRRDRLSFCSGYRSALPPSLRPSRCWEGADGQRPAVLFCLHVSRSWWLSPFRPLGEALSSENKVR